MKDGKPGIVIVKDGPYLVTGGVPLNEKIIACDGSIHYYEPGRPLPQAPEYALCRCGASADKPFCDGAHYDARFDGTETASRETYDERAELLEGPALDLLDDNRCAFARFCHRYGRDVWELTEKSDRPGNIEEAVQAALECPTGRLVPVHKNGEPYAEPAYGPSIDVLQDPERGVGCGLFVKGNIPISSEDGELYEVRNRVVLCRCGKSREKPFCEASHVRTGFLG